MGKRTCIYCGSRGKLTREHVIPAFLHRWDGASRTTTSKRNPGLRMSGAPTVRIACARCNNGVLSDLDAYAKGLTETYFQHPITGSVDLEVDTCLLRRWLLKISINETCAGEGDRLEHFRHAHYVTGLEPEPRDPMDILVATIPACAATQSEIEGGAPALIRPDCVRIANLEAPEVEGLVRLHRVISINSFIFHIVVWDRAQPIERLVEGAVRLTFATGTEHLLAHGSLTVPPGYIDAREWMNMFGMHMGVHAFPRKS